MSTTSTTTAVLGTSRYASLRSFTRDGRAIDTPIWFALDGDRLWFRSKQDTHKIRRLTRDPRVELRPCTWRGAVIGDTVIPGTARVLPRDEAAGAERRLAHRYGWQWNLMPLIQIPGTGTVPMDLTMRGRWQHWRATELWPGSCIVECELAGGQRSS